MHCWKGRRIMHSQADMAVYSPNEGIQLAVEVKSKLGASPEWARQMHQNLLIYAVIPETPYFLLVLPDFIYLWKNTHLSEQDNLPDYQVETKTVLAPYTRGLTKSLNEMTEYSLEMLVDSWLNELTHHRSLDRQDPTQKWLIDSGLFDAINRGTVVTELAL